MSTAIQVQPGRSERTKRLIMDNATRIFFERGFKNVSVEELCKMVGVSKGTFYKHFENRDALVEALVDECLSEAVPAMVDNFESDKDVETIIETHYNLLVDLFMSKVSVPMMADMESQMPQTWERIQKQRRAETRSLMNQFKRGQARGSIRKDVDPAAVSAIFEEIMQSIFRPGFLMSSGLTLNQVSSTIKAVLMHGIVAPERK